MNINSKTIIVIVGPTASGKTKLGIDIAKYFKTEIISADSRQIYNCLKLGTAQPTNEEINQIKHHLIDFVDVKDYYSVAQYEQDSLKILQDLFKNNDIVVIVGGTGFYINALCNGIDDIPEINKEINDLVDDLYQKEGLQKCVDELLKLDSKSGDFIELQNPVRVIRALKVIKNTGKPIYEYFNKTKKNVILI